MAVKENETCLELEERNVRVGGKKATFLEELDPYVINWSGSAQYARGGLE